MKKLIAILPLLGSCMHGDLKIDYLKEKGKPSAFEMHVDLSAEDTSVELPKAPTYDNAVHKQLFTF